MNRCQRRLLKVFVESGGDVADKTGIDAFTTFVQSQVMLLSPAVRRAMSIVLEEGDRAPYRVVAEMLSRQEGRTVTLISVRARVSRGVRAIEHAIRSRGDDTRAAKEPVGRLNGSAVLRYPQVRTEQPASAFDRSELWAVPPPGPAYA